MSESVWYSIFVGAALKSTAVLGVAWLITLAMRRQSAAARHLVWTAAAAAVLVLPVLSIELPALHVPGSINLLQASSQVLFETTTWAQPSATTANGPIQTPLIKGGTTTSWSPDWRLILMLIWAAGASLALTRMLIACAAIYRMRRTARQVPDPLCGALSRSLGIRQPVDVLETASGSMPMTFGVLRTAIYMPSDSSTWSEERRRVVLLHELAHVRRGDVATHLLARVALTLYWWNPLAWKAWREFFHERERATDDLVLNAGTRPSEYASHLLEVARSMHSIPAMGWAAVAMARPSELESRLAAILAGSVNRKAAGRASALAAAVLTLAIIVPLAAVRAQENAQPQGVPADVEATIRAASSQKNPEMLDSAAMAAAKALKYDMARTLLDASLTIRGEASGEQSAQYGGGLLNLGKLEQLRGNAKASDQFYGRAAQVLGDKPAAAVALIHLGTSATANKQYPEAIQYFQRAKNIDPKRAGQATMWLAIVQQREGNMDEAEALFKNALTLEDPQSPQAVTLKRVYAQFLGNQNRPEEAEALEAQIAALRKASLASLKTKALSPGVYRIGGDVKAPSVLSKVEPEYTDEARAAMLSGTEVVTVEISADGIAHNIQVVQGLGLGLDENGIKAISQWRFKPGTKDGQPVTVSAVIEINYRLM